LIAASLALLSGCGDGRSPAGEVRNTAGKPAARARIDRPVEDALAKVPPQQRAAVQTALACRVKAKRGPALVITPQLIQEIVSGLKDAPSPKAC
jgi:hypothetical protein